MITALTALLVLISLALVVTVPVALATPGEWESSKDQFNKAFQLWVGHYLWNYCLVYSSNQLIQGILMLHAKLCYSEIMNFGPKQLILYITLKLLPF